MGTDCVPLLSNIFIIIIVLSGIKWEKCFVIDLIYTSTYVYKVFALVGIETVRITDQLNYRYIDGISFINSLEFANFFGLI